MNDSDAQFLGNINKQCVAAITRGDVAVPITPELLVILLEDCGKVLKLTGENERLREGIEDIADRIEGWTDHDGVGPREALLTLIEDE